MVMEIQMTKPSKHEIEILGLINKIQEQLNALDKKIDSLINRPMPQQPSQPKPTPPPSNLPKERVTYKAICADCSKECTIPFKPSGDRPVYCQDCFSRRKMINLSKIGMEEKPKVAETPKAPVKLEKKAVVSKKTIAKKKSTAKKK